jgi:hypothetical protein
LGTIDLKDNRKIVSSTNRLVNRVLIDWNPIMISTKSILKDEYSTYAPEITKMLLNGANEKELFFHLKNLRIEKMQVTEDDLQDIQSARKLLELVGK